MRASVFVGSSSMSRYITRSPSVISCAHAARLIQLFPDSDLP